MHATCFGLYLGYPQAMSTQTPYKERHDKILKKEDIFIIFSFVWFLC